MTIYLLVALLALASGITLGILFARARESALRSRLASLETEVSVRAGELRDARAERDTLNRDKQRAEQEVAVLNERLLQERNGAAEKLELLTKASQDLQNAFHRLAAEALASNNQSFLQLAKTSLETFHKQAEGGLAARESAIAGLVKPIEQSLNSVKEQVKTIETQRVDAYSALRQQIVSLSGTQEQLKSETAKLVQALRAPHVRGRWGEIQLRRAVEIAGMLDHCDFVEQSSVTTDNGRLRRPDMIIRLPGGKQIVVDSKAPLRSVSQRAGGKRRGHAAHPDDRPRAADSRSHGESIFQKILGAVRLLARFCGDVSSRRSFFQRRPGARSGPD